MNKKTQTYSIRGKLVSAACMLLVAVIMVVSSTYAWFTLSTAPEVTGIQTAIGANGALEMALFTGDEPKDGVVNTTEWATKNLYWGNLVDLSNGYGLDQITLYPSMLNVGATGLLGGSALKVPVYGSDGRVSDLAANTTTGLWDAGSSSFLPGNGFGVRAVGSASGMTPRQLAYRNARSEAGTATSLALTMAAQSLNSNGSALANIAIAHGLNSGSETYTQTDVQALRNIVADLNNILAQIETAYMQYILACAASAATTNEAAWSVISGEVTKDGATLDSVLALLEDNGVDLPDALDTAIAAYETTKGHVATANTKLSELSTEEGASFAWNDISAAMTPLVDTGAMEINGIKASEVKDKMQDLVDSVMANSGLTVTMASGGGVYADIADQCGNYSASVTINEVNYGGLVLKNMTAKMNTNGRTPAYLPAIGTAVTALGSPSSAGATNMPITEFYGYILDLAFRTNAAESNLLLQTQATDRIYEDNANDETMGGGSTMTFASTDSNFKPDQVKKLMESLRVVFFTPSAAGSENLGTVLKYAKLDMTKAKDVVDADGNAGFEAPLYIYEVVDTFTYTVTEGDTSSVVTVYGGQAGADSNPVYYTDVACTTVATIPDGVTPTQSEKGTERLLNAEGDDNSIIAMTQNATVKVSALVYLDGESITNADVSATQAKSLTGKMNLQFSSSANLTPMEYANLHQKNTTAGTTTATPAP